MQRIAMSGVVVGLLLAACSDDSGTGGAGGSGGSGGSGGGTAGPLVIETDKGAVEGALLDATRAFYAIPYAAPPVGDLRWKAPSPADPWTETLEAKTKGSACAQNVALGNGFDANTNEDCLTVNVWTPNDAEQGSRPVLVWIHGGGFTLGSNADQAYDGKILSETTGAVVVSMNYRLGVFGFLAHADLAAEDAGHPSSGAYGIEDQRAALEWVKTNIEAFGGDPAKVTLFGESAGGISTCFHLVSPLSEGLFSSAILESGPCDQGRPLAAAEAQGEDLAVAVGCDGEADVPACLRSKTPTEVSTALTGGPFIFGTGASWFPAIDGYNLPEAPQKMVADGDVADVPIIIGANADEATIFFALAGSDFAIDDEAEFEMLANGIMPTHGAEIVAMYPASEYGSPQKAAEAAIGDAGFICNARRTARHITENGGTAYLYHFTHAPEGALFGGLGSFHSAEVRYVFGTPGQLLPAPLDEAEVAFSKEVMGYWFGLSEKGDPNGGDLLAWPAYDPAKDEHLTLAMPIESGKNLKKDLCDFWDSLYEPAD